MGGAPAHRRGAASTVRLGCVWRVPLAVVMRMALLGAVVLVVHASLIAPHHSGRSRHSILTPSSLRMISTNIGLSSSSSSSRRSETGKQRQRQSPLKSRALLPSAKGTQSSSLGIRSRATSFWQTGGGEPHSNDTKKTRVRPLQQQQADSNEENTNSAAATISSLATIPSTTTTTSNTGNNSPWEWVIRTLSQSFNFSRASPSGIRSHRDRHRVQLLTLLRVGIPSVGAGIVATLVFPALALALAGNFQNPGVFSVLSQDSSQFVQNFLTVAGLLFSILVGQTCTCARSVAR